MAIDKQTQKQQNKMMKHTSPVWKTLCCSYTGQTVLHQTIPLVWVLMEINTIAKKIKKNAKEKTTISCIQLKALFHNLKQGKRDKNKSPPSLLFLGNKSNKNISGIEGIERFSSNETLQQVTLKKLQETHSQLGESSCVIRHLARITLTTYTENCT